MVHACNPSYVEGGNRRISVGGQPGQKHETLSQNKTRAKKVVGMAQVRESFPSKHEALNSNSGTTKEKKRKSHDD
jgi:hypothetical protein